MLSVRWRTTVVEQGHASASLTKRAHAAYGSRMMLVRSHLHMMRSLFSPVPVSRTEQALRKKAHYISTVNPEKLSGRQLFYADYVAAIKAAHPDQPFGSELAKEAMRKRAQAWRKAMPSSCRSCTSSEGHEVREQPPSEKPAKRLHG